jgi:hypothetical protein
MHILAVALRRIVHANEVSGLRRLSMMNASSNELEVTAISLVEICDRTWGPIDDDEEESRDVRIVTD